MNKIWVKNKRMNMICAVMNNICVKKEVML